MALGCALVACSALASHSRGGRQSSPSEDDDRRRAARQAALRFAPGGLEAGRAADVAQGVVPGERMRLQQRVGLGAGRVVRDDDPKRSRSRVCSDSASSSHRNRSGRSCDATTTAISGDIGAEP
jgi:hypothetical protein